MSGTKIDTDKHKTETLAQMETISRIAFKMQYIYGADREKVVAFSAQNKGNYTAIENFIDEFKKGG